VWKVYAAIAKNYADSNYYISGQRKARKARFSTFDAACAGLFHDKIFNSSKFIVNLQQIHKVS
jgi:hypothetical protein